MQVTKRAHLKGHNAAVFALSPSGREQHILSGGGEGWIAEWDLSNPEHGRLLAKIDVQVFSLLQVSGSNLLVAGDMNGGLHWIDLDHPERTLDIAHHSKGIFSLLQQGDALFTAGGEGKLTRWSIATRRSMESFHLSNQRLRALDYCPQRDELAVGSSDGNIYLLDVNTLELRGTLEKAHTSSVFSLRYASDGSMLYSGGRDAHLRVWDTKDWSARSAQPAHWFTINAIAVHPTLPLIATGSRDKTLKIWDARDFKLLKVLDVMRYKGHPNSVNALLWVGTHLISGSDDRTLIVWEVNEVVHSVQP